MNLFFIPKVFGLPQCLHFMMTEEVNYGLIFIAPDFSVQAVPMDKSELDLSIEITIRNYLLVL